MIELRHLKEITSTNKALSYCKSVPIDDFIKKNEPLLFEYSKSLNIDFSEVKRQIKLHIPKFELSDLDDLDFWSNHLEPLISSRFKNYSDSFKKYLDACGHSKIDFGNFKIANKRIANKNASSSYPIKIQEVTLSKAIYIEKNLHYLRSFRTDGIFRIGVFLPDFNFPMCYMSFCNIDRTDKLQALKKSLNRENINASKIIELSRVYGCGKLPNNTISYLIAQSSKHFRNLGYEFMITAVNPYLDFRGASILASNFFPFTFRTVNYFYSEITGEYISTRALEPKRKAQIETPKNILFLKNIGKNYNPSRIEFII